MKTYVGIAKNEPGLADAAQVHRHQQRPPAPAAKLASWPLSAGIAEAAYCAPEEIDTATVST